MSGDENGVVTRTVTRGQMIQALQQLPVAEDPPQPEAAEQPRRRRPTLRRTPPVAPPAPVPHKVTCPLAEADVADLLLAHFPELEPASLKAVKQAEGIIAERDQEIRLLREEDVRKAVAITDLRKAVDGHAGARHDIELVLDGVPGLPQDGSQVAAVAALAGRCCEAEAENVTLREALAGYAPDPRLAAMKAALERFAAPGVITATDRRKAATDALRTAQGDAEATP